MVHQWVKGKKYVSFCQASITCVDTVLGCLKELKDDNNISDKDLTLKTVMLMALTAIKRCSDLHLLDTRFMALGEDKVMFKIMGKPKNFRNKGKMPEPVTYWVSGEELCPVSTIRAYVDRTETWRKENSETSFFLSFIQPHRAVTASTIGRWSKTVLGNVGVDTSKFTAHSTRSAASSKYKTLGASVSEIMKCGNWSSSSTWQRFYHYIRYKRSPKVYVEMSFEQGRKRLFWASFGSVVAP